MSDVKFKKGDRVKCLAGIGSIDIASCQGDMVIGDTGTIDQDYSSRPYFINDRTGTRCWLHQDCLKLIPPPTAAPSFKFNIGEEVKMAAGGCYYDHPVDREEHSRVLGLFPTTPGTSYFEAMKGPVKEKTTKDGINWYRLSCSGNWVTESGLQLVTSTPVATPSPPQFLYEIGEVVQMISGGTFMDYSGGIRRDSDSGPPTKIVERKILDGVCWYQTAYNANWRMDDALKSIEKKDLKEDAPSCSRKIEDYQHLIGQSVEPIREPTSQEWEGVGSITFKQWMSSNGSSDIVRGVKFSSNGRLLVIEASSGYIWPAHLVKIKNKKPEPSPHIVPVIGGVYILKASGITSEYIGTVKNVKEGLTTAIDWIQVLELGRGSIWSSTGGFNKVVRLATSEEVERYRQAIDKRDGKTPQGAKGSSGPSGPPGVSAHKFKVGDKIIGNKGASSYGYTNEGWKGVVVAMDSGGTFIANGIEGSKTSGNTGFGGLDPSKFDHYIPTCVPYDGKPMHMGAPAVGYSEDPCTPAKKSLNKLEFQSPVVVKQKRAPKLISVKGY